MNSPSRKSPAAARGLGSSICNGGRPDHLRLKNSNPFALPASARFDCDGLVLPRLRDADAVAAAIVASGAIDRDSIWGGLNGWRFYQGKWYAARGGEIRQTPRFDMDAWVCHLLLKCLVVNRAGRVQFSNPRQANVRAVRCALGRALTVCDDPTRKLVAVGGAHDR